MVRVRCCDQKMGLKKGPWIPEEDKILINYIQIHGHSNWRALPKQAGLLRCGKSCRLRWINYLRPDIKRGNFTNDEEDSIINLHQMLGNRWSAIAARLPGRTDNEIKNVWHTHLKKRLKENHVTPTTERERNNVVKNETNPMDLLNSDYLNYSTISTMGGNDRNNNNNNNNMINQDDLSGNLPEMDENFWLEVFSTENWSMANEFTAVGVDSQLQYTHTVEPVHPSSTNIQDEPMNFWNNIFTTVGELPELQETII